MSMMHRIRAYHAILAALVVLSYLSGEMGLIHAWLGYAVAALVAFRLFLGLTGLPQLGLMRFYPQFDGLKLGNAATHPAISRTLLCGIAACLIGTTIMGIAMDRGRAIALAETQIVASAWADDDKRGGKEEDGGLLGAAHEVLANWLMLAVLLHVSYLLLFKWPLARFMIYADGSKSRRK